MNNAITRIDRLFDRLGLDLVEGLILADMALAATLAIKISFWLWGLLV